MRKFNVIVNGEAFEVEIQEAGGESQAVATAAPAKQAAPAPAAPKTEAAPAPKPVKKAAAGSGTPLLSPLPGTVLNIRVKEGQTVKITDVVAVLEAMKMENDIPAGTDGVVTSIQVKKGDSVQAGDVMMYIA